MDPSTITFAALITPPGIITAGGFVTVLVQIVKGVFPTLDAKVSGALQALFFTSVLYILTGVVLASSGAIVNADGYLWVFTAWLTCAASAIGIKAGFTHAALAATGAKGDQVTEPIDESDLPDDGLGSTGPGL